MKEDLAMAEKRYHAVITTRASNRDVTPQIVRVELVFDWNETSRRVADSARNRALNLAMHEIYARLGSASRTCVGYHVETETEGRSPFTRILPE
jgi:hypothetical protein